MSNITGILYQLDINSPAQRVFLLVRLPSDLSPAPLGARMITAIQNSR